ncbi:hypothetical protein Purlil1_8468 [Purpureocillium lilacinum]|uniref:Uncharacterized protein n=1 Tax=Purpureocillium lilacinum TaxID=33203 RepID=A0ABR0BT38_PURLI|nr:hypothetical protein Purlil1_8468 [Purpureocillium lilacinum]
MHALPATFPSLSPAGAATPKIPPPPPTSTEEADDPCGGRLASTPALLSDPQLLRPAPIIDPSMPSPLRPQGGRAHGISHGCTLHSLSVRFCPARANVRRRAGRPRFCQPMLFLCATLASDTAAILCPRPSIAERDRAIPTGPCCPNAEPHSRAASALELDQPS